ncbi:MAG TPA: hypothetical protein VEI06_12885 [Gemmatimonadaceae bacterium]|nr:hypothetical protein [Gemmatimonadaceae bacterium]
MSPLATYLLGVTTIILGLAVAAFLLDVPPTWIFVAVVVAAVLLVLFVRRRMRRD